MNDYTNTLNELFSRIPRRHTAENVKELYGILDEYEDLLKNLEEDDRYATGVLPFFEEIEPVRALVKKSNDSKNSKKAKDELFDEASGSVKDSMENLKRLITSGKAS